MEIIKRNWKLKLSSLIVAIILWSFVIIGENPVVTTRISNVQIYYENLDAIESKDLVLLDSLRPTTEVAISGQRNNILTITPQHIRVTANLNNLDEGTHTIRLNYNLPDGITLNEAPQTITVNVEKVISRDFAIKIVNNGELSENYILESAKTTPDKVTIKGARSKLDSINLVTAQLRLGELKNSVTLNEEIKAINSDGNNVEQIIYGQQFVNINVNILKQKEVEITPQIVGDTSDEYKVVSSNLNRSTALVKGPEAVIDKISKIKTQEIDISNFNSSRNVPVKLVLPTDVNLVNEEMNFNLDFEIISKSTREFQVPAQKITVEALDQFTSSVSNENVKVQFFGFSDELENIKLDDITLQVNAQSLTSGTHQVKPQVKLKGRIVEEELIGNIETINLTLIDKTN